METGRSRILIIDDTPANIHLLHGVLRDDYEVRFATSGPLGLALAAENRPDLILLDIMMPEMDGYQVCTHLKSDPALRDIPVIFITALGGDEDETYGLECGAIDYITKPISPPVVKARVRNHLELKRHRDALAAKNRELENERELAHAVLDAIVPQRLTLPGLNSAAFYRPSNSLGGDFFDAWDDGRRTHLLIGDISGHSISAALLMAVCKGVLQSFGRTMGDPLAIVTAAARLLTPTFLGCEMFMTLVYAVDDRTDGSLRVVSAGHPPLLLVEGETIEAIAANGPPIGWDLDDRWDETVRPGLRAGQLLFLYTDGLTEASNAAGELFEAHLPVLLQGGGEPAEVLDRVRRAAEAFGALPFTDDVTLLAVARRAP